MSTFETAVVALMGVLALAALAGMFAARRRPGGATAGTGYLVFAVGALLQAGNLWRGYSTTVAVLATLLLAASLVMITRGWERGRPTV